MTDIIGSILGMGLIFFIVSPVLFIIYVIKNSKIDVDGDGKEDVPYRWQK